MEEYGAELCRRCGSDTRVVDTRYNSQGIKWRRRKCIRCGYTYHTKEVFMTETKRRYKEDEKT
jgi:transcriptional regulator NrdR family protein